MVNASFITICYQILSFNEHLMWIDQTTKSMNNGVQQILSLNHSKLLFPWPSFYIVPFAFKFIQDILIIFCLGKKQIILR